MPRWFRARQSYFRDKSLSVTLVIFNTEAKQSMSLLELKKQQVTDKVFLASASSEVGEGAVSTPI